MNHIVSKNMLAISTALTLSLGIAAAPAFAQTAPEAVQAPAPAPSAAKPAQADSDNGADIVVTARRMEERLQDVPISITVFNQAQVANRNIVNATDLAAYTPSLSSNSNFGAENSSFAIRGFVQDPGTPPSVGVYFADVVAPRGPTQGVQAGDGAGPGSFFDLQNIQVLKGPQGTLQGRNTTGGAVLFVPQKPTSKTEGYIEAGYGNYDTHRVQAMFNTALSDTARFRIAMDHQDRDGYIINDSGIGPRRYGDVNYTAVRASLVVDLTPDLENYTIVSYSKSDTKGSVQKQIACLEAYGFGSFACAQQASAAGAGFYHVQADLPNPTSQLEQWQVINTTTWHASDTLTIKNITSYAQFRDLQASPLFGENWFAGTTPVYFTVITPAPNKDTANQSTFTEELQAQGHALDDKLTYQAGAYMEMSDPLGASGNQTPNYLTCSNYATLQCTDILGIGTTQQLGFPVNVGAVNYTVGKTWYRDYGLYTQATYAFTDKLKLTAGARYTWDKQVNDAERITYHFPVTAPYTQAPTASCTDPSESLPNCEQRLQEKSHKPTWLIDLDYKPTDDILLYGKWARGYRAGGVFSNAPIDHRTFQPEKVDSFEVGAKTTFRPLHATFDIDGFYNNFTNQQLQAGFFAAPGAPVSPTTGIINAGKSRIWGIEAEGSIVPFHGLQIDASYTYLNATVRKINEALLTTSDPNYVAGALDIPKGSPLALSPKNKASVTVTYTLPLDPSLGKIGIGATFTHTDKQLTTYAYIGQPALVAAAGANYDFIPKTNLLNLNLNWNSVFESKFDLSVYATNVTQKHYYLWIPGLNSAGFESAVLGQPRFYGFRVRYRF